MAVPLAHFLVGLAFLLVGAVVGALAPLGVVPGRAGLAHVHLLLVGWVAVTIVGAMTQFVPVWSGTRLHSRRLAVAQLWLTSAGLAGFVAALLAGVPAFLPVAGAAMLAGFWTFVYVVGRTLWPARPWDVTERHFALALAFFLAATALGALLALSYARPLLAGLPVDRLGVRTAHVTLAVFGGVLTTVLGALYQLATMFTQSELHGVDHHLRRVEEWGYPLGVALLAAGRLAGHAPLARVGGLLVVAGVLAFAVVLARRLIESHVAWTPMLRRYAVVTVVAPAWALTAAPAWLADPLADAATFGAPGLSHLLLLGVVGFVVAGTLYHVVPFIVWVGRYADQLGLADVPMIDDLYDDRVAAVDLACLLAGSAVVVAATALSAPAWTVAAGGAVASAGFALFAWNLVAVVREHGEGSVLAVVVPLADPAPEDDGNRAAAGGPPGRGE
jgi:hypothetical protein